MNLLTREEGEALLLKFFTRALKNPSDVETLMALAREHPSTIPMKGIIYQYDRMEKNVLSKADFDDLSTLMFFYGP
ncbi:hypothetical protein [Kosakonia sacchari]|uniref:Bacteriocin immunity protein n=1 Tax=Kosakonia sacchari TaxID=1158459 RepID=A0A1G4XTT1_9ENTR|nr:hypothetical protein [Kosakonia sacchari]AHJ73612.1 hypothetical protein C813_01615 [Kosakonia sacchari SP1]SCX44609.1 hypothetical protein SAMN02927897_01429 [Kosakonia sacchari]